MQPKERALAIASLSVNVLFLAWLVSAVDQRLAWLLVAAEFGFFSVLGLKVFNSWNGVDCGISSTTHAGSLDIFLPVVNEDLALFRKTLSSANRVVAPRRQIYVLDDGPRDEVRALAELYGARYVPRVRARRAKAHNLNHGLLVSEGDFILVLDADQAVHDKRIAADLCGHFADVSVALVATRQRFHNVSADDFNQEPLFYERMQPGKNAHNAAFSCGSGVIYRRSALEKIGGFQEWNLVEDLTTSYILHTHGFRSLYTRKVYAEGLAPVDLPSIYQQRLTWATDTLRLFVRRNPLWQPRLTARQRIHYWETGWSYLVSALCVPFSYGILAYSLFANAYIIPPSHWYLLFKLASTIMPTILARSLSSGSLSTSRAWAGLWPVHLMALARAFTPKRAYRVTNKEGRRSLWHVAFLWPQALLLGATIVGLATHLRQHGVTNLGMAGAFWITVGGYWLLPFLQRALSESSTTAGAGDLPFAPRPSDPAVAAVQT